MPTMEALLREAAEKGASDLHLSSGEPPMLRVHGDLVRTEHPEEDRERGERGAALLGRHGRRR